MEKFLGLVKDRFSTFGLKDVFDILILALIVFLLYRFLRKRRVFSILLGVIVFVIMRDVFGLLGFEATYNVMNAFCLPGILMIAIVFQTDIRSVLECTGSNMISFFNFLSGKIFPKRGGKEADEIVSALLQMADSKTGAILILERSTGTDDVCEQPVIIDAVISRDLILNLFFSPAPLHDGAVVIRNKRVFAAGCFLPNSAAPGLDSSFGSRHRAGIALSKVSDADVFIVSEEEGSVSYAHNGELSVGVDEKKIREVLAYHFGKTETVG